MMETILEEWFKNAISKKHISYFEFNKFTDPVKIGSGGFGEVFKYEWKGSYSTVALKCLRVERTVDEKAIKNFINELKLLQRVNCHPNVIAFYGVTKDSKEHYNLVLQYANTRNAVMQIDGVYGYLPSRMTFAKSCI
ncbi:kinase-like protein [Gigaspora margarita]|uniref:Kinase-like protein n=1 Tax=Gigaspora margarita TaxID=4874 RepID=A0A8H3X6C8_GIGMA|nr:kinase-like protein [Gigaspora margarita]